MSRFAGEDLFGSGPHTFHVHGVSERHQRHEMPGADGMQVTTLGKSGRRIEQTGTLMSDDVAGLGVQLGAIEAVMSGEAAELVDDLGRRWSGVVMLGFEPGPVRRVGPRVAADYRVSYVQVQP